MSEEPAESGGCLWSPGAVVWVKLGSCWWPGSVVDAASLPADALRSLRKTPLAIVHFFQEDFFEFVRNENAIYPYNCSRKDEFIKKGLDMYRGKQSHNMDKFPEDVIRAEELTGGDVEILTRDKFQQEKKESYAGLFGDTTPRRTPGRAPRGRPGKSRVAGVTHAHTPATRKVNSTPSNYKAHILVQGSSSPAASSPAPAAPAPASPSTPTTPATPGGLYTCHACPFSSTRLNVMIMHTKSHASGTCVPYVPSPTAVPATTPRPAQRRPRKHNKQHLDSKKPKSVVEIKNTLLADWEDGDDSSMDEPLSNVVSAPTPPPPVQTPPPPAPAPPPPALTPPPPESSNGRVEADTIESSCFDFREDDELPAGGGGKLVRARRAAGGGAAGTDEEVAREVDQLLEQTALPALPDLPHLSDLQRPQNFPHDEQAKSPDKQDEPPPNKTIFKTKTFFRSRHSRSQDAIEKYVAEQLNAAERHSNDSPPVESPPPQEPASPASPPPAKLARLAPKIQLKKMNAEAQLRSHAVPAHVGDDPPDELLEDDVPQDRRNGESTHAPSQPAQEPLSPTYTQHSPAYTHPSPTHKHNPPDMLFCPLPSQCNNGEDEAGSLDKLDCAEPVADDSQPMQKDVDDEQIKNMELGQTKSIEGDNTHDKVDGQIKTLEELQAVPHSADQVSESEWNTTSKSSHNNVIEETVLDNFFEEHTTETSVSIETPMESIGQVGQVTNIAMDIERSHAECVEERTESVTESDLQIAQTLISLPDSATHHQHADNNTDNNLNAARSLVQMSENNTQTTDKQTTPATPAESETSPAKQNITSPSKLLQILEEKPKTKPIVKVFSPKPTPFTKEKILNFNVSKSPAVGTGTPVPARKQIIIRRTVTSHKPSALVETNQEKIVLSPSTTAHDGISTYTIHTTDRKLDVRKSPSNTIIIQQKARKLAAPNTTTLQRMTPVASSTASSSTPTSTPTPTVTVPQTPATVVATAPAAPTLLSADDAIFDINSMPIVLSEDLLPSDKVDAVPMEMATIPPVPVPTLVPAPSPVALPAPIAPRPALKKLAPPKPHGGTILVTPIGEKSPAPNILSKSSKIRATKPMLVVDKATGEQKIIMTKTDPTSKEIKITKSMSNVPGQSPGKGEKFIILPTTSGSPAPRQRTHKILIGAQSGKPPPAQLPTPNDPANPSQSGGTVMIITNAQGGQSRIVLSAEHEKLLFPNKQQAQVSKQPPRLAPGSSKPQIIVTTVAPPVAKPSPRIITKQKQQSAIITSKGQLIVSGAPAPRPLAPAVPPPSPRAPPPPPKEPVILLQQKSGAIMQLTAAQFEHLQRTGQIVQKSGPRTVPKQVVQKLVRVPADEVAQLMHVKSKSSATLPAVGSPAPKKPKLQERKPLPLPVTTAAPAAPTPVVEAAPPRALTATPAPHNNLAELDNLEELLPSTAIARPLGPEASAEPPPPPPQPPIPDNQLLAVPGENFGGPPNSFYLCVEENGTLTPIDNRPLVLDNNQLVPMEEVATGGEEAAAEGRRDILAAALANTDVFRPDAPRDDLAPDFRDLNANVSVHCRVSETSMTLNQPIMTPLEVPSAADRTPAAPPPRLEEVIGTAAPAVPVSLELPITVTDPRIAPPPRALSPPPPPPPSVLAISMPLLSEEDDQQHAL